MSCFFYTIPPPPSSTLFPYTTLFRSRRSPALGRSGLESEPCRFRLRPRRSGCRGYRHDCHPTERHGPAADRKSTRLNSSHLEISYAVFCLKKKKKNITPKTQV